jgi:hypothetical protein
VDYLAFAGDHADDACQLAFVYVSVEYRRYALKSFGGHTH